MTASIGAGAAVLESGEIAGLAKLDASDVVYFKDGKTFFEARKGLGIKQYSCTKAYWCPSIEAWKKLGIQMGEDHSIWHELFVHFSGRGVPQFNSLVFS